MQFKKISSIFEYTSWVLKKFNYYQQSIENNIYRIVEIKQGAYGQYKLIIQIIGKSTVIECTPQEVAESDCLLEGFSKKDIRIITYFACTKNINPEYRILTQEFCSTLNRIQFKLKNENSGETFLKSADQIFLDKILINKLSKEDICSISYVAGYEQSFVK